MTDKEHLLELLYDGNTYYLNMATINVSDPFYELYKAGYVTPAPNNATWYLRSKGYDFMKNLLASRECGMSEKERLQLFVFEQGMKYAKRSSQHKITKQEFLRQAIIGYDESEDTTS